MLLMAGGMVGWGMGEEVSGTGGMVGCSVR